MVMMSNIQSWCAAQELTRRVSPEARTRLQDAGAWPGHLAALRDALEEHEGERVEEAWVEQMIQAAARRAERCDAGDGA